MRSCQATAPEILRVHAPCHTLIAQSTGQMVGCSRNKPHMCARLRLVLRRLAGSVGNESSQILAGVDPKRVRIAGNAHHWQGSGYSGNCDTQICPVGGRQFHLLQSRKSHSDVAASLTKCPGKFYRIGCSNSCQKWFCPQCPRSFGNTPDQMRHWLANGCAEWVRPRPSSSKRSIAEW